MVQKGISYFWYILLFDGGNLVKIEENRGRVSVN